MAWPMLWATTWAKNVVAEVDDDDDGTPVGDALGGGRKDRGEHEDVAVDVGAHATAHALYG